MTVDNYLRITRAGYEYGDESMKTLFENMAKQWGLEVTCVVIKSNMARTEYIKLGEQHYIIWDLNYWKIFESYLRDLLKLDSKGMDKEQAEEILWNISLKLLFFFQNYFPQNSNASYKFARFCWVHGCVELEDYDNSDLFMNDCLFICKMYMYIHEIYHMYFQLHPEEKKIVEGNVRNALKQCETLILEHAAYFKENSKTHLTKEEVEELLHQLIWGNSPIYDELLSDAAAFYQTSFIYFSFHLDGLKKDWPILAPKVRNCIFEIRCFELILKTLISIVDNVENRLDVPSEIIMKEHHEHSRKIFLREFIMQYIEIDQFKSIFSELDWEQILAIYRVDIIPPFRKSYYKFVRPYFDNFAGETIIPILLGI